MYRPEHSCFASISSIPVPNVLNHPKIIFAGLARTSARTLLITVVSDIMFGSEGILFATVQLGMQLVTLAVANPAKVMSAVLVAVTCTTLRTVP